MIDDLRLGHDLDVICILHTSCMQDSSRYASPYDWEYFLSL